jgi:hypothetical protein
MEEWVRVQNEHDRQVLAWLRERIGDATVAAAAQACARGDTKPYLSTVCRQLGLSVPRFSRRGARTDATGCGFFELVEFVWQPRSDWVSER